VRVIVKAVIGLIGIPLFMLATEPVLSNAISLAGGSKTVPYEDGGRENIHSAAARISCFKCTRVYGGERYDFEIEVFDSCWDDVYSIEFEAIEGTVIQPFAWPRDWTAAVMPELLVAPDRVVFETETNPILAGRRMAGFAVLSTTGKTSLRWFPANQQDILMGKVTRVDLSCPTVSESPTWGSVKALYR
jgi:hypothetical protein